MGGSLIVRGRRGGERAARRVAMCVRSQPSNACVPSGVEVGQKVGMSWNDCISLELAVDEKVVYAMER